MASYYDDYTYYSEPDYYGSSNTYQEPDNYIQPPNTYYSEEPQYYEDTPHCLEPTDNEPQYYKDALHYHTGLEPVDDENWPMYEALILSLPRYEDLHPMYQDYTEGLGDCAVEEEQDDEGCGSNESAECPPSPLSVKNVCSWVDPDPNCELSDEEWEALVAEHNAAADAALDARERELEEYYAVFNSMDPLEQDELNSRMDLLAVGEDRMDLLAVGEDMEKPPSLFSLDAMALPPQFDCSPDPPHYIDSTVSRLPRKTRPPQRVYLVTAASKPFTHFRKQNRPTQHRHPPRKKPPPSQPYPTPRQCQYSDSRTKPHCKHPPNHNLPTKTTLDIGNNAHRRISQKAARIS